MEDELHVDVQQVGKRFQKNQKPLFIYNFERLLEVRFHKVKELCEALLEFGSGLGVVFQFPVVLFSN